MSDRVAELELHAARARRNVVRMIETGHSGHLGGAMSAIDLITALYFDDDWKNFLAREAARLGGVK